MIIKNVLTVLDYVGQAHKNYNFYEKFSQIAKKKGKSFKRRNRKWIYNTSKRLPFTYGKAS